MMAQKRDKTPIEIDTAKILVFANRELDQLVDDLYTSGCKVSGKQEIVGALVCAARSLPIEVVAGFVRAYWVREKREKAAVEGKQTSPS